MGLFLYYKLTVNEYPLMVNILGCVITLIMAFMIFLTYPGFNENEKMASCPDK